eukprot:TRINITY_DN9914_c0_g1_i1.p1 TRINITY_DN9914_c0_g1~~TRINITY_DN9914_c0_g1_i1.p1  ORF type:complete len:322 (+),score=41.64 TRINITY_DN9914_c0_g1_i1:39-968(+)
MATSTTVSFLDLDPECLDQIMFDLPFSSVLALRLCSKDLYDVASNNTFWGEVCRQRLPQVYQQYPDTDDAMGWFSVFCQNQHLLAAAPPSLLPRTRVWIYFASAAPVAVILCRTPTSGWHMSHWDLQTDEITSGQFLFGTICTQYCDLSPDGRHFLYFKHRLRVPNQTVYAVCKPPYFTAVSFWAIPWGTKGGGRFVTNNSIELQRPNSACWTIKQSFCHPDLQMTWTSIPRHPAHAATKHRHAGLEWADWSVQDPRGRVIAVQDGKVFISTSTDTEAPLSGWTVRLLCDLSNLVKQAVAPPPGYADTF